MKIRSVDTVHFGLDIEDYSQKAKDLLERLSYLKMIGQEIRIPQQIELNDTLLTIELTGARFYAYRLTCKDFTLLFAEKPNFDNPPVMVNLSSGYLWSYGYIDAYKRFMDWFQTVFRLKVNGTRISRLDIAADTDEATFNQQDIWGLVTYSKTRSLHFTNNVDDINFFGRQFTGITIGRGKSILCRIYDKTKEIQKSGKEWFKEIWEKYEWKNDKPVWRVEFQIRRKVLKEFSIESVEDSFDKMDGIWIYLTSEWLEIRNPIKNVQPSRWNVKSKWQVIQSVVEYKAFPLIREKVKQGNLEKFKAQAGGLLISIAAAEFIEDIDMVSQSLKDYLTKKLKVKGKKFEREVYFRRGQYMGGLNYAFS